MGWEDDVDDGVVRSGRERERERDQEKLEELWSAVMAMKARANGAERGSVKQQNKTPTM